MKGNNDTHLLWDQIAVAEFIIDWADKYDIKITNAKLSVVMYFLYAWYKNYTGEELFPASFLTYPEGPVEICSKAFYAAFGGMSLRSRSQNKAADSLGKKSTYIEEFLEQNAEYLTKNYGLISRYLKREDGPWRITLDDPKLRSVAGILFQSDRKPIPGELIAEKEKLIFCDQAALKKRIGITQERPVSRQSEIELELER